MSDSERPSGDVAARPARATILDVARVAGVSRQTVTRAMNDMSEISSSTRERVLAASEALGYRPSRFAANMARQKSIAVGLVITSLRNPYYTDLAADLLERFSARGWQAILVAQESFTATEVVSMLSTQVDAIVGYFAGADAETDEAMLRAARGVPIVFFESEPRASGIHSITIDFATGIRDYLQGLRDRGARRIGMIEHGDPRRPHTPSSRQHWFEEYVGGDGAPAIAAGDDTIAGGALAFAELLERHPELDTVVAFNDMMAIGAVQRAHQLGLAVPERIRIAGIDGLNLGSAVLPPLTSLSIDRPLIATSVTDMLAKLLADPRAAMQARNVVITPRPEWRESA